MILSAVGAATGMTYLLPECCVYSYNHLYANLNWERRNQVHSRVSDIFQRAVIFPAFMKRARECYFFSIHLLSMLIETARKLAEHLFNFPEWFRTSLLPSPPMEQEMGERAEGPRRLAEEEHAEKAKEKGVVGAVKKMRKKLKDMWRIASLKRMRRELLDARLSEMGIDIGPMMEKRRTADGRYKRVRQQMMRKRKRVNKMPSIQE